MKIKANLQLWVYETNGKNRILTFYNADGYFGTCLTPSDKPIIAKVEVDFDPDEGHKAALEAFDLRIIEAMQEVENRREAKQKFLALPSA